MRILVCGKAKAVFGICAAVIVLGLVLQLLGAYLPDTAQVNTTAVSEESAFEVRSRLLMDAMREVGVCSPEAVVDVWSKGLMRRSGALQYAVMSEALGREYVKQLEQNSPSWVTGVSSPWISGYKIYAVQSPDDNVCIFEVVYSTETSTGPFKDYKAVLTVGREGDFWRIIDLSMDEGLYPYTGFKK